MDDGIERRRFLKGAGTGVLAFTVGGARVMMTPSAARAEGVPFRLLKTHEAHTIEALGDTLVPGAAEAGIAHFIDTQVAAPAAEALLQAREFNVRPPFVNFYRAVVAAIDRAAGAAGGNDHDGFAALGGADRYRLVDAMRQNRIDGWQGPPGGLVYNVLRNDALDVVYGTIEGHERLGVPYMAHIEPDRRW